MEIFARCTCPIILPILGSASLPAPQLTASFDGTARIWCSRGSRVWCFRVQNEERRDWYVDVKNDLFFIPCFEEKSQVYMKQNKYCKIKNVYRIYIYIHTYDMYIYTNRKMPFFLFRPYWDVRMDAHEWSTNLVHHLFFFGTSEQQRWKLEAENDGRNPPQNKEFLISSQRLILKFHIKLRGV